MRIGILGRDAALLRQALDLAEGAGHDARGTLVDDEALAWVRAGQISALLVGGGVEPDARTAVLDACGRHGVRPVEVSGPGVLGHALAALGAPDARA